MSIPYNLNDNYYYGMIGNCRSAALVSATGSIDWCCLPEFNSPSVFARILDTRIGGHFSVEAGTDYKISQSYIRKTNILVTRFTNGKDAFELIDFMPRYIEPNRQHYTPPDIVRYLKLLSGKPRFRVSYKPALQYAAMPTETVIKKEYIKSYSTGKVYDSIYLYTDLDKEKLVSGEELVLEQDSFMLLSYNQKLLEQTAERSYLKLQRTKVYWLDWSERTRNFSRFNEEIVRSALVLKLLSYDKSGAILAAATTSLPETIGEIRNWDYRFCWLRDASMVIKVMGSLGHLNVARRYLEFILDIIPVKDEKIQIMYGINKEKKLKESILSHLEGYQLSLPVRVGNDAYRQKQNDIYGILMDVIYQQFLLFENTLEHGEALWTVVRSIIRIVARNWKKCDRGIWELRTKHQHFTFSKVLCWVAIDRGIHIARLIKKTEYVDEWVDLRKQIKEDILKKAWNGKIKAFTQYYGSEDLDAANLLMESFGFIRADDERYIQTVLTTKEKLMHNGLMYRYRNRDDFGQPMTSFTICTFWMIDSLYKIGRKKEAEELFARVLSYSNHLGLFSEDIDFESKRLLGNFPQAYSHLALIETAVRLSEGSLAPDEKILKAFY